MTPETEKLEEALAIYSDVADIERMQAFEDKYGIEFGDVVEQAARRYAEVLPLLGAIIKGMDLHNGTKFISKIHGEFTPINVTLTKGQIKQIAAIVARGE